MNSTGVSLMLWVTLEPMNPELFAYLALLGFTWSYYTFIKPLGIISVSWEHSSFLRCLEVAFNMQVRSFPWTLRFHVTSRLYMLVPSTFRRKLRDFCKNTKKSNPLRHMKINSKSKNLNAAILRKGHILYHYGMAVWIGENPPLHFIIYPRQQNDQY
jgi:hypothetical protein